MKTKYIKVAVSDELPKKDGFYTTNLGHRTHYTLDEGFVKKDTLGINKRIKVLWYLLEVPDHEAELVEMLEVSTFSLTRINMECAIRGESKPTDPAFINNCYSLIQKVKSDE